MTHAYYGFASAASFLCAMLAAAAGQVGLTIACLIAGVLTFGGWSVTR